MSGLASVWPAKGDLGGGFGVGAGGCPWGCLHPPRAHVSRLHTQLLARVESHEAGAVCNKARALAQLVTICNSLKIPFFLFAF